MEWQPGNMSSDIEDRRDDSGGRGGGFRFGGGGGIGIVGVLVLLVISVVTGHNFLGGIFGGGGSQPGQPTQQMSQTGPPRAHSADEDRDAHLISKGRQAVSAREAGTVPRIYLLGLRHGAGIHRAVLLSAG